MKTKIFLLCAVTCHFTLSTSEKAYENPVSTHIYAQPARLHTRAAYFDPGLQRWLNRDPLGESADWNLFRTISNNAISISDPFGLWAFPLGAGSGSTWCPDRCPCTVTCTPTAPGTPGKPHHLPGQTYPYYVTYDYPYHCEDCTGRGWNERRSKTHYFSGPGSKSKAAGPVTYTIWVDCKDIP
jgi:RHS repeat-associated protein